ncbi:MAG: DUF2628 domain-containing protein [Prochlorococcus sp.]
MAISLQMQKRLDKIQALIDQGYTLEKSYGFPVLKTSEGKAKPVGGFKAPTGFSWIAFFFPFAVCTQIREWNYFYVVGIFSIAISITTAIFNIDFTNAGTAAAIGVMYGFNYPYLRYLSNKKGTEEIPVLASIVLGIVLSIICAIPSIIIDAIGGIS